MRCGVWHVGSTCKTTVRRPANFNLIPQDASIHPVFFPAFIFILLREINTDVEYVNGNQSAAGEKKKISGTNYHIFRRLRRLGLRSWGSRMHLGNVRWTNISKISLEKKTEIDPNQAFSIRKKSHEQVVNDAKHKIDNWRPQLRA